MTPLSMGFIVTKTYRKNQSVFRVLTSNEMILEGKVNLSENILLSQLGIYFT